MAALQKTVLNYGDKGNMFKQAIGLFATHMNRNSGALANLVGQFPTQGSAESIIKNQTSTSLPIVRSKDLTRGEGDEVTFNLVNPVGSKPIMGRKYAEGRGVGVKLSEGRLRVDQARFPVDLGDVMTQIRSPADLHKLGRPIAQSLADRYIDQTNLVHMAGARGFHNNIEWVIPTTADPDFAEIMVNPVLAPTRNRHFLADGANGIKPFGQTAGEVNLITSDVFRMATVDGTRTYMEQIALPPPPVKFHGDTAADDSPLRVMLVSPAQYSGFAMDPNFRQIQASALARASQASQHPIFRGDVGLWNGILIIKMMKPIRFYAGDAIKYSADYTSDVESSAIVPAAFGTNFAVDRAILLGGQALGEAYAASRHTQVPFFWSEKEFDHGDKFEVLIGMIRGAAKIRFDIDQGNGSQLTDYGVTVIDTAVPIIGARL